MTCEKMEGGWKGIACSKQPTCDTGFRGTPADSDHFCRADGQNLILGGCVAIRCKEVKCEAGLVTVDPNAVGYTSTSCCASDCKKSFKGKCASGTHLKANQEKVTGATAAQCCEKDLTDMCVGNSRSGCTNSAGPNERDCQPAVVDVKCPKGYHPKGQPALYKNHQMCKSVTQRVFLGLGFETPKRCLDAGLLDVRCGDAIMWSATGAGCYCCVGADGADGGYSSNDWAVYKASAAPKRPSASDTPKSLKSLNACCEHDATMQCVGNTVSGTDGSIAPPPDVVCGAGTTAAGADKFGNPPVGNGLAERSLWTKPGYSCCNEIDGCAAVSSCGKGGVCSDIKSPGTGYTCKCDQSQGYQSSDGLTEFFLNTNASCVEVPCTTNPPYKFLNGASTCAGTRSGQKCAFKCIAGYMDTMLATCTRGKWSTDAKCQQRYEWTTLKSFTECRTTCGAVATTQTRTVECVGRGDKQKAASPGLCTQATTSRTGLPYGSRSAKPMAVLNCPAVVKGMSCDDKNDATMNDLCTERSGSDKTLVCKGTSRLSGSFTVEYGQWGTLGSTKQSTLKIDMLLATCDTLTSANIISTPETSNINSVSGSVVDMAVSYVTRVDPDHLIQNNIDAAIALMSSETGALAKVQIPSRRRALRGIDGHTEHRRLNTALGAPTPDPFYVYSYVKTTATCPSCNPAICQSTCAKDAYTLSDSYACMKKESQQGSVAEPANDADCINRGVGTCTGGNGTKLVCVKPSSTTKCQATPACIRYDWSAADFEACPTTCGAKQSVKTRTVTCAGDDGSTGVNAANCTGEKPPESTTCDAVACVTYKWNVGSYSPATCDIACASGKDRKVRSVKCEDSLGNSVGVSLETVRCTERKPSTMDTCICRPQQPEPEPAPEPEPSPQFKPEPEPEPEQKPEPEPAQTIPIEGGPGDKPASEPLESDGTDDGGVSIGVLAAAGGAVALLGVCAMVAWRIKRSQKQPSDDRRATDHEVARPAAEERIAAPDHVVAPAAAEKGVAALPVAAVAAALPPPPAANPAAALPPKYTAAGKQIRLGKPAHAAHGMEALLGVSLHQIFARDGMDAIQHEFQTYGSDTDKGNLSSILNGTYVDSHGSSKTLDELMNHQHAIWSKLERYEVLALRLYTTSSYSKINDPLRADPISRPVPFACTTYFISMGIKKLKAVGANMPNAEEPRSYWRGMKDLGIQQEFLAKGGTEFACVSTTASKEIAFHEFASSGLPLIFEFRTKDWADRGADISFLSVFPNEQESLSPPLTFLRPVGTRTEHMHGAEVLIATVEPTNVT